MLQVISRRGTRQVISRRAKQVISMGGKAGDRQDSLSRTGGRWWAVAGGSRHKDFTG